MVTVSPDCHALVSFQAGVRLFSRGLGEGSRELLLYCTRIHERGFTAAPLAGWKPFNVYR
jgi:hypothetical protein